MFPARRRGSSGVRAAQIFHELKQRFPAVPDRVVTACVASHIRGSTDPMGHHPPAAMTEPPKRPDTLDIRSEPSPKDFGRLRLSEKCKDVHKLLNSPACSEKPPRPPRTSKSSPTTSANKEIVKKETASTPTQTTDTLLNNLSPSVNLSLNVNVVQCATSPKCTTTLQVTPTQPWLNPIPVMDPALSPRSFTSVNLTLRPPTSTPQDPIDITSQNSSLTYSTSSFDREKGLQSRLQITVGPGGGSVASTRARPRSSYIPEDDERPEVPARAGSLNNLALTGKSEAPVLLRQQARIERMRIELRMEKAKLVIMKEEVAQLERNRLQLERLTDIEVEKQLVMEINHLRCQCEQLALADKELFYNNIYTGPMGPLLADNRTATRACAPNPRSITAQAQQRRPPPPQPRSRPFSEEGARWSCHLCTFLNHPDLAKCEQCDMPRVLHGTARARPDAFSASNITLAMIREAANVPLAALNFDVRRPGEPGRSLSLSNVKEGEEKGTTGGRSSLPEIAHSGSTPGMFNLG